MSELNLNAVDLQSHIGFTYERDDGKVRSWPDHVLTFSHYYASRRSRRRDTVKLTVCLSVCVCVCVCVFQL